MAAVRVAQAGHAVVASARDRDRVAAVIGEHPDLLTVRLCGRASCPGSGALLLDGFGERREGRSGECLCGRRA